MTHAAIVAQGYTYHGNGRYVRRTVVPTPRASSARQRYIGPKTIALNPPHNGSVTYYATPPSKDSACEYVNRRTGSPCSEPYYTTWRRRRYCIHHNNSARYTMLLWNVPIGLDRDLKI